MGSTRVAASWSPALHCWSNWVTPRLARTADSAPSAVLAFNFNRASPTESYPARASSRLGPHQGLEVAGGDQQRIDDARGQGPAAAGQGTVEQVELGAAENEPGGGVAGGQFLEPGEGILGRLVLLQTVDALVELALLVVVRAHDPGRDLSPPLVTLENAGRPRAGGGQQEVDTRGGEDLVDHQVDQRDHLAPQRFRNAGKHMVDGHAGDHDPLGAARRQHGEGLAEAGG